MNSTWKNWCRLCASPEGGVSILNDGGTGHFLSEKIKKYLSISVSEGDNGSHLLCSKCQDHLTTFDKFVHQCVQVQAMYSALCQLVDDNIAEERLHEIRRDFLCPTDFELCRGKSSIEMVSPNGLKKNHLVSKIKENGNSKRQISPSKRKGCEERNGQLSENNFSECRKSGRLRAMAVIKQAFGEEDEILGDSLDSDFNEDSFENLLDSDDAFQPVLRNSVSGYKIKDDNKLPQSLFNNVDLKQALETKDSETRSEKEDKGESANSLIMKRQDVLKIRDSICNEDLTCGVLSSDVVNGTCVSSLSDTDISDFICEDNDEGAVESVDSGNNDDQSRTWKSQAKHKTHELATSTSEQQEKMYELNEMFEESENEDCSGSNGWNVHKISDAKVDRKKKKKKDPNSYKCDQCEKSFPRKALLTAHLTSHVPKDQQPYVCCKCARRFHCETLLRNHERVHLPNEEKLVYPCDVCNKKFSSRSAVTAHLKAIHYGERPFVCHLCGHSFSSKGILQEHLTIHSDEEPWHCTSCSKRFKTKYRLKIHMDTHRETPYSCPHCPVQLSTRRTLRMHLVVHRDTKAYQCATCGKAFRRAKDLKNHHNLHTGRRPYTCPFCSRTFANGSNCRSHKRRMHPEELRLYEAALAANGGLDLISNATSLETDTTNNGIITSQDLGEEGNESMKEDSQDSLLTEMALDLQQPQILSVKPVLSAVHEDPVVTAADLTLAPLVTLTSTLPKLEPDDSRLVMNLTTQMHDGHDSMEAMSPLNLNIMSPMNLNISSPLNLNISSPLNLNISSVLHSPTGRNQQQHSVQSQHNQNPSRYQQAHQGPHQGAIQGAHQGTHQGAHQGAHHHLTQQQPQPLPQHLSMQPALHQSHQQIHHHHQQISQQHQGHQQLHQQQIPRSATLQIATLQTSLSSTTPIHTMPSQTQLPAHLNNVVHHVPQIQTFIPLNQQGTLYSHHTAQDSVSSAAIVAAAAVAHSMTSSGTAVTTLPSFSGNPYVQQSMAYGRGANM